MSAAVVVRAYRFALDPTPAQVRELHRHAGAARFAFNWALSAVKANIGQRAAERSYVRWSLRSKARSAPRSLALAAMLARRGRARRS